MGVSANKPMVHINTLLLLTQLIFDKYHPKLQLEKKDRGKLEIVMHFGEDLKKKTQPIHIYPYSLTRIRATGILHFTRSWLLMICTVPLHITIRLISIISR